MPKRKYRLKKHTGVYAYNSEKNRVNGKPDVCYYIVYKVDGKNKTEKIGWVSEGYTANIAAEIRAKRIRTARHTGQVKTAKEIRAENLKKNRPLGDIKNHYFDSEHGKAIKGRKNDMNRWEVHLSYLDEKSVPELSPLEIERIKQMMANKNSKPATVDHALRLLRRIINHGVKHDLCPALSFKISFPKVKNKVTEYLTPEEAERLLFVLDNWKRQDIARMIKLAWITGMRRGELFRLKIDDIDLHHELINIRSPKGGEDTSIPLSPPAKEIILQQIAFLEEDAKRRERRYRNTKCQAPPWEEHGYIFPGRYGTQRIACNAARRIKAAANLPQSFRPFHGLRHHYAVVLASSGQFTLDMIGELLTHKDSSVTRRYAVFLPDAKKKAAARASELLQNQAKGGDAGVDNPILRIANQNKREQI
ncbi:MAG: integrase [Deltaproteobacteria bacterium]|nr:MAG: integrase [Deltaproteobacteria bacterium]